MITEEMILKAIINDGLTCSDDPSDYKIKLYVAKLNWIIPENFLTVESEAELKKHIPSIDSIFSNLPRNTILIAELYDSEDYDYDDMELDLPIFIDKQNNIIILDENLSSKDCESIHDFRNKKVFNRLNLSDIDQYDSDGIARHIISYQNNVSRKFKSSLEYLIRSMDEGPDALYIRIDDGSLECGERDYHYLYLIDNDYTKRFLVSIAQELYRIHDIELKREYFKFHKPYECYRVE